MKKRIILIVMVVMLVSVCGISLGQDINMEQEQKTKQKQQQEAYGGEGGSATAGVQVNFDRKVQAVQSQMPEHLLIPPTKEEVFFWNKYGIPKEYLERTWTRKEVENILKHTGVLGAEFGWGFKKMVIPSHLPRTDSIDVKVNRQLSEISGGHSIMLAINVSGNGRFTQLIVFAYGLMLAMNNGANMVLLNDGNDGLNTVTSGKTFGFPFSAVSAGKDSAFAAGIGFGRASIKKIGEPGIILTPLVRSKTSLPPPSPLRTMSEPLSRQVLPRQVPIRQIVQSDKTDKLSEQIEKLTAAVKDLKETMEKPR